MYIQYSNNLREHSQDEIADIINVGLESMAKCHYELPAFDTFLREAKASRAQVYRGIFEQTHNSLSDIAKEKIKKILTPTTSMEQVKSTWDLIKQEPKKPTVNNVREFVDHLRWLKSFDSCLPVDFNVPASKLKRFIIEARALNVANMNELTEYKRFTLAALLVRSQTGKALDDIGDIFIRIMQRLLNHANEALKLHKLSQSKNVESLVSSLRDIMKAYQTKGAKDERFDAITQAMKEEPEEIVKLCNAQLAYANNNYLPFLPPLYRNKRSLLFDCLSHLDLQSTTKEQSTLEALALVARNRRSRKTIFEASNEKGEPLDLDWIPDNWRKLVIDKTSKEVEPITTVQRKYFELCLFTTVAQELKSGDLIITGGDKYGDFREQLVSWAEYYEQISEYGELAGIETEPKCLIES
jgi:hypothetical protein